MKSTMVALYGRLQIRLPAWLSHGRTLLHAHDVDGIGAPTTTLNAAVNRHNQVTPAGETTCRAKRPHRGGMVYQ